MRSTIFCALVGAAFLGSTATALAESSIQYHGDAKPKYDKKIQAAAIERAISKIGDLRGSLKGFNNSYLVTEKDLKAIKSSSLGFPRIQDPAA